MQNSLKKLVIVVLFLSLIAIQVHATPVLSSYGVNAYALNVSDKKITIEQLPTDTLTFYDYELEEEDETGESNINLNPQFFVHPQSGNCLECNRFPYPYKCGVAPANNMVRDYKNWINTTIQTYKEKQYRPPDWLINAYERTRYDTYYPQVEVNVTNCRWGPGCGIGYQAYFCDNIYTAHQEHAIAYTMHTQYDTMINQQPLTITLNYRINQQLLDEYPIYPVQTQLYIRNQTNNYFIANYTLSNYNSNTINTTVPNLPTGNYALTLIITDATGKQTTSNHKLRIINPQPYIYNIQTSTDQPTTSGAVQQETLLETSEPKNYLYSKLEQITHYNTGTCPAAYENTYNILAKIPDLQEDTIYELAEPLDVGYIQATGTAWCEGGLIPSPGNNVGYIQYSQDNATWKTVTASPSTQQYYPAHAKIKYIKITGLYRATAGYLHCYGTIYDIKLLKHKTAEQFTNTDDYQTSCYEYMAQGKTPAINASLQLTVHSTQSDSHEFTLGEPQTSNFEPQTTNLQITAYNQPDHYSLIQQLQLAPGENTITLTLTDNIDQETTTQTINLYYKSLSLPPPVNPYQYNTNPFNPETESKNEVNSSQLLVNSLQFNNYGLQTSDFPLPTNDTTNPMIPLAAAAGAYYLYTAQQRKPNRLDNTVRLMLQQLGVKANTWKPLTLVEKGVTKLTTYGKELLRTAKQQTTNYTNCLLTTVTNTTNKINSINSKLAADSTQYEVNSPKTSNFQQQTTNLRTTKAIYDLFNKEQTSISIEDMPFTQTLAATTGIDATWITEEKDVRNLESQIAAHGQQMLEQAYKAKGNEGIYALTQLEPGYSEKFTKFIATKHPELAWQLNTSEMRSYSVNYDWLPANAEALKQLLPYVDRRYSNAERTALANAGWSMTRYIGFMKTGVTGLEGSFKSPAALAADYATQLNSGKLTPHEAEKAAQQYNMYSQQVNSANQTIANSLRFAPYSQYTTVTEKDRSGNTITKTVPNTYENYQKQQAIAFASIQNQNMPLCNPTEIYNAYEAYQKIQLAGIPLAVDSKQYPVNSSKTSNFKLSTDNSEQLEAGTFQMRQENSITRFNGTERQITTDIEGQPFTAMQYATTAAQQLPFKDFVSNAFRMQANYDKALQQIKELDPMDIMSIYNGRNITEVQAKALVKERQQTTNTYENYEQRINNIEQQINATPANKQQEIHELQQQKLALIQARGETINLNREDVETGYANAVLTRDKGETDYYTQLLNGNAVLNFFHDAPVANWFNGGISTGYIFAADPTLDHFKDFTIAGASTALMLSGFAFGGAAASTGLNLARASMAADAGLRLGYTATSPDPWQELQQNAIPLILDAVFIAGPSIYTKIQGWKAGKAYGTIMRDGKEFTLKKGYYDTRTSSGKGLENIWIKNNEQFEYFMNKPITKEKLGEMALNTVKEGERVNPLKSFIVEESSTYIKEIPDVKDYVGRAIVNQETGEIVHYQLFPKELINKINNIYDFTAVKDALQYFDGTSGIIEKYGIASTKTITLNEQKLNVVIEPQKIEQYLLTDPGKAKGFELLGYTPANKEKLTDVLCQQTELIKTATKTVSEYGDKYTVTSEVIGLNNQMGRLITAWQVDTGTNNLRFITGYIQPYT